MGTAQQMNMILVHSDRFHLDRKSFLNLVRRLSDHCRHLVVQQGFAIFHRKHNVVVDLPRTVCALPNFLAPLILHVPEGTREQDPRSKLRGITS